MAKESVFDTVISTIIQLGLLIAAIWLAIETGKLRKKTAESLDYSRAWDRFKIAPTVAIEVGQFGSVETKIKVHNVSENLVSNCVGFLYDHKERNFIKTPKIQSFITAQDTVIMDLGSKRYDLDELLQEIKRQLSQLSVNDLRKQIESIIAEESGRSILAVIVHSALRDPYLWIRVFDVEEGRRCFKASPWSGHPIPISLHQL